MSDELGGVGITERHRNERAAIPPGKIDRLVADVCQTRPKSFGQFLVSAEDCAGSEGVVDGERGFIADGGEPAGRAVEDAPRFPPRIDRGETVLHLGRQIAVLACSDHDVLPTARWAELRSIQSSDGDPSCHRITR